MKFSLVLSATLLSAVVISGCAGRRSSSSLPASTEPVACTPPVKSTLRVSHVTSKCSRMATASTYKLDLSGVQPAVYAKELEVYTENALKFGHPSTDQYFKPLTRNDAKGKVTVKVSFSLTEGASGRRGTRNRAVYTLVASEGSEVLWTVSSSCESAIRDKSVVNTWLAGLVSTARMYIGQNKVMPMQSVTKYPDFLNAVYGGVL